jgi:hypothetical protein
MMKWLEMILFLVWGIMIGTIAASYRAGDFIHTMAVIKRCGDTKSYILFEPGRDEYTIGMSLTYLLPEKGDVGVKLVGDGHEEELKYKLYSWYPPPLPIDKGMWPAVKGNTIEGLMPKKRMPLWVVIKGPEMPLNYNLMIYDSKTGKDLLKLPVKFSYIPDAGIRH